MTVDLFTSISERTDFFKVLKKTALFLALNLGLVVIVLTVYQYWIPYREPGRTFSALLPMPKNERFDVVMLGTSHTFQFSRFSNLMRVETQLNRRVWNLGKGGGGVVPMMILLDYFYSEGNQADQVVYFLDIWSLLDRQYNEARPLGVDEPIKWKFLTMLINYDMDWRVIYEYFTSKVSPYWLQLKIPIVPIDYSTMQITTDSERESIIAEKHKSRLPNGADAKAFPVYLAKVEALFQFAAANNSSVVVILPPSLHGLFPEEKQVLDQVKLACLKHNVTMHNFSEAMQDPLKFSDISHLNSAGVEHFMKFYVLPTLKKKTKEDRRPL